MKKLLILIIVIILIAFSSCKKPYTEPENVNTASQEEINILKKQLKNYKTDTLLESYNNPLAIYGIQNGIPTDEINLTYDYNVGELTYEFIDGFKDMNFSAVNMPKISVLKGYAYEDTVVLTIAFYEYTNDELEKIDDDIILSDNNGNVFTYVTYENNTGISSSMGYIYKNFTFKGNISKDSKLKLSIYKSDDSFSPYIYRTLDFSLNYRKCYNYNINKEYTIDNKKIFIEKIKLTPLKTIITLKNNFDYHTLDINITDNLTDNTDFLISLYDTGRNFDISENHEYISFYAEPTIPGGIITVQFYNGKEKIEIPLNNT